MILDRNEPGVEQNETVGKTLRFRPEAFLSLSRSQRRSLQPHLPNTIEKPESPVPNPSIGRARGLRIRKRLSLFRFLLTADPRVGPIPRGIPQASLFEVGAPLRTRQAGALVFGEMWDKQKLPPTGWLFGKTHHNSFSNQRTDLFCISIYCGFHMAWIVCPTAVNTTRPLPKS